MSSFLKFNSPPYYRLNRIVQRIHFVFAPPVFTDDEDKTRRAAVLNILFVVGIFGLAVIMLGNWLGGRTPYPAFLLNFSLVFVSIALYVLLRRGHVTITSYLWVLALHIGITAGCALLGTIRTPTTSLYFALIVAAGLLIDVRTMVFVAALSSLSVAGLIVAENSGWLPPPDFSVTLTQWVTFSVEFGFICCLVYLSVRNTKQALARARDELAQREQAEAALQTLTAELGERVAERTRQLSTANEQLQTELQIRQHAEQELAVRLHVTRLLAHASALEEIAPRVLQAIAEPLGWHVGEFYLLDLSTQLARFTFYWNAPDPLLAEFVATSEQQTLPVTHGIPARVIASRRAIWIPDATLDSRVVRAPLLAQAGLHGGVAFPIQVLEEIWGLLFLFSREVRPFDSVQMELFNQVGSELSQFILRVHNQQVLQRTQQELAERVQMQQSALVRINALYSVGQNLVLDKDLPALLQGIADTLVRALPANRVALVAFDDTFKRVEYFIKSGPGSAHLVQIDFDELHEGLTGWVLREYQAALSPRNVPDPRESPRVQERRRATDCGAILVAPLLYQTKILGTLTAINTPTERDFAEADLRLMQAIANQAAVIIERKRSEVALAIQNQFLAALNRITLDLLNQEKLDDLLQAIVRAATELLDAPFGQIFLADGDALVVTAHTSNLNARVGERLTRDVARLAWQAFDTRQPTSVDDYETWEHRRRVHDRSHVHAAIDLPIYSGERDIGVLALGRTQPNYPFDAAQIQYGALFAQLVAVILDTTQLRESLREQAIRDPLTGLYNRRFMQETLTNQIHHAFRTNEPIGILLLDIDHFKSINDCYGHRAGDEVLQQVALFLKQHLRAGDIACRYGGEEFILILPGASLESTYERAQELRHQIEQFQFAMEEMQSNRLTISVGVAAFPQHASNSDGLIDCADEALYRAKQAGRNRVNIAG